MGSVGKVYGAAVVVQSLVAVLHQGRVPVSWGLDLNTESGVFLWERHLSRCSRLGPSHVGLTEGLYVKCVQVDCC